LVHRLKKQLHFDCPSENVELARFLRAGVPLSLEEAFKDTLFQTIKELTNVYYLVLLVELTQGAKKSLSCTCTSLDVSIKLELDIHVKIAYM